MPKNEIDPMSRRRLSSNSLDYIRGHFQKKEETALLNNFARFMAYDSS